MAFRNYAFRFLVAIFSCLSVLTPILSQDDPCSAIPSQSIELLVPERQPAQGESFCLPITVRNFIDVTAVDIDILFNSEVLSYDMSDLVGLPGFINTTQAGTGRLKYLAFPPSLLTLPDDATLVEICFTVIGDPGDFSPLVFSNIEIIQEFRFRDCNLDELNSLCDDGSPCNSLQVKTSVCPTQTSVSDGAISFCICGGNGPYDVELVDENGNSYATQNNVDDFTIEEFSGLDNLGPSNRYLLRVTESDGITTDLDDNSGAGIFVGTDLVTCEQEDPMVDVPPINIMCSSLQLTEPRICSPTGTTDGSISFSICGGTGPYSYTLVGPSTNLSENSLSAFTNYFITDLAAGDYTLTLEDNSGSSTSNPIMLATNLSAPLSVTLTPIDPVCEDWQLPFTGGSIEATVIGGSGIHSFSWSTTPENTSTIRELDAGNYALTVQDVNGCAVTEDINLVYDPLDVNIVTMPALCEGQSGSVLITATGGRPRGGTNYDYEVDDFGIFQPTFSGTYAGDDLTEQHTLIVLDDTQDPGCAVTETFVVGVSGSVEVNANLVSGCAALGTIAAQMTSDGSLAPNIVYELRNSAGALIQGPSTVPSGQDVLFDNLAPDEYVVFAEEDGGGCSSESDPITFVSVVAFTLQTEVIQPSCINDGRGTITVTNVQNNGVGYTFEWEDGLIIQDDNTRIGLPDGNYFVTATEIATGCEGESEEIQLRDASITLDINNPSDIVIEVEEPGCNGTPGSIAAPITNLDARADAIYTWYRDDVLLPDVTPMITGLGEGTYRLEITGGDICPIEEEYVFGAIVPFTVEVIQPEIVCFGDLADFSARTSINTGNVIVTWENTLTGEFLPDGFVQNNVSPGTYRVRASDPLAGCDATIDYTVQEYDQLTVPMPNTTRNDCFGAADAIATLDQNDITGGTGNERFFLWSNDPDNPVANQLTAQNLPTGEHWVLIFDDQCASDSTFFMVDGGDKIQIDDLNTTINPPLCFGEANGSIEFAINGGSGTYDTYRVSGLETGVIIPDFDNLIEDLPADSFEVRIIDDAGCAGIDTIVISEPDSLVYQVDSTSLLTLSCNATSTGLIKGIHTGGNDGRLEYTWSHDATLNSPVASNLGENVYTSTLTDINGCQDEFTYEMLAPQPITVDYETTQFVQCFGKRLEFGGLEPSGGTNSGYRFTINNGSLIPVADSILLFAGRYDLTIFDQDGCSLDTTLTVIEPDEVVVELGPDVEINLGDSHQLSAEHDPEEDIVLYEWDPMEIVEGCSDNTLGCSVVTVMPQTDTVYGVRIENSDGCADEDEVMIRVKRDRNVYIPNVLYTSRSNSNSSFSLFSGQGVDNIEYLRIYDRWGNLVHAVEQVQGSVLGSADWDARHNGTLVEAGVYLYSARVRFTDGETLDYKGDLTVIH